MKSRHGGTLRLELRSSDASGARSDWSAAEPPDYLCTAATAILRTLLRDRQTGSGKSWPRRIQRWRAEPDPTRLPR
jgi:hypothetical protein